MDVEKDYDIPPPSRGRSTSRPSTSRSHRSARQRSRSPSLDLFQREKLTPYPVPDQQPLVPSIDIFSRPSFELEPLQPSFLKSSSSRSRSSSPFRKPKSPKPKKKSKMSSIKSAATSRSSTDAPKLSFSSQSSGDSVRKPPRALAPPITYPNTSAGNPPPYSNPWDEEMPLWDKQAKAKEIQGSQNRRRWQYAIVAGIALTLVVIAVVAPLIYVHNGKGTQSQKETPGA